MTAILSNFTADSLAKKIESETGEKILTLAGFDAWVQSLIDFQLDSDLIFILLHAPAIFPDGVDSEYKKILEPLLGVINNAKSKNKNKIFVVSTLDIPQNIQPIISKKYEYEAQAFWRGQIEDIGIAVFDLSELAARFGREKIYSAKMWFAGSIPFSMSGEKIVADEIIRISKIFNFPRKKCVILDLDNTLWGGVVGEEQIKIAQFGMYSQYREFQRVMLQLKNMGVLLAVVSKNNIEDALKPFRENSDMLLRENDFVSFTANWEPKPDNILNVAKNLNIGLDSMVFIDDSPVEREAVKALLPQVVVPDFPSDTSLLPAFARDVALNYFQKIRATDEDSEKTRMYAEESQRNSEKSRFSTVEEYLASLEMKFEISRVSERDIARAAELTQKTNQFNLTTRRYNESEMSKVCSDPNWIAWIGSLSDKFGDYGKIILCIVNVSENTAKIDTFLMSCRAMGRDVEKKALRCIEQELFGMGVKKIVGEYIETEKNSPAKNFFAQMGYAEMTKFLLDINPKNN